MPALLIGIIYKARKSARLQSFPDWFEFKGSEESRCKQIGNAVPPLLAKALAVYVKAYLKFHQTSTRNKDNLLNHPIQLSFNFVGKHTYKAL
ncbi:DNA cytosine methyltransferase [Ancylothrix sp. D3o]|uniref:DNA cytosine methyltransferase n=1 Tax=Ancylothrix sp. D3o TaxID=2953691 RepID=UPI0035C924D1